MLIRKIALGLVVVMALSTGMAFASEYYYTDLEGAIERSVEVDANIRKINANIPAMEEGIRQVKSGVSKLDLVYDAYKAYASMWDDPDETWDRLKDMSTEELVEEQAKLYKKLERVKSASQASEMMDDLEFIAYAQMFGIDDPVLTKAEIYSKYVGSIELGEVQAQNSYDKTLNKIDLIKGSLAVNVTAAYLGIKDMEVGIQTQKELLQLREDIYQETLGMYEEGLVSDFDLYSSQNAIENLKLEIEVLELRLDSLYMTLKEVLGYDAQDSLSLSQSVEALHYVEGTPISTYVEQALSNSSTLEELRIDLGYYEKNKELYDEYDGYKFGATYEELNDSIQKYSSKLREGERTLETNVYYAVADIVSLKEKVKLAEQDYSISAKQLSQAEDMLNLGLAKQSDVHTAQIARQSKKMALDQANRAYKSSVVKFNMLVEYGIEYE